MTLLCLSLLLFYPADVCEEQRKCDSGHGAAGHRRGKLRRASRGRGKTHIWHIFTQLGYHLPAALNSCNGTVTLTFQMQSKLHATTVINYESTLCTWAMGTASAQNAHRSLQVGRMHVRSHFKQTWTYFLKSDGLCKTNVMVQYYCNTAEGFVACDVVLHWGRMNKHNIQSWALLRGWANRRQRVFIS